MPAHNNGSSSSMMLRDEPNFLAVSHDGAIKKGF
jgi:hypothetical protein